MNEFPYDERCKHSMIPYYCDTCISALARGESVEPHVQDAIEFFNAFHAPRPARPPERRYIPRARRRNRALRAETELESRIRIALKREQVISPVGGYKFEPKFGREHVSGALPAHLR